MSTDEGWTRLLPGVITLCHFHEHLIQVYASYVHELGHTARDSSEPQIGSQDRTRAMRGYQMIKEEGETFG